MRVNKGMHNWGPLWIQFFSRENKPCTSGFTAYNFDENFILTIKHETETRE
jgi:hypothetical protein